MTHPQVLSPAFEIGSKVALKRFPASPLTVISHSFDGDVHLKDAIGNYYNYTADMLQVWSGWEPPRAPADASPYAHSHQFLPGLTVGSPLQPPYSYSVGPAVRQDTPVHDISIGLTSDDQEVIRDAMARDMDSAVVQLPWSLNEEGRLMRDVYQMCMPMYDSFSNGASFHDFVYYVFDCIKMAGQR